MSASKLGRGLEALIPSSDESRSLSPFTSGRSIVQLDVEQIVPNPRQPRKSFDEQKLEDLSKSISEHGIASPILVRKRGNTYEIIAGERRFRAAKKAGLDRVPVIIKEYSDEQSLEIAIVENLQREDLNPVEEALAYNELIDIFKLTHEQIAKKVGKDRSTVSNTLRLLDLPKEITAYIASDQISAGHARPLLSVEDKEMQINICKEIISKDLSVRDVEALIASLNDSKPSSQKKSKQKNLEPIMRDVKDKLIDRLGTKVDIIGNPQKGKVVIHYFSQEDLERLLDNIGKA